MADKRADLVRGLFESAQRQAELAEPQEPQEPEPTTPDSRIHAIMQQEDVEVYGFRLTKPDEAEEVVQLSVRLPKSLRQAIHVACAQFDLTVTEFARLAFEQVLFQLADREASSRPGVG